MSFNQVALAINRASSMTRRRMGLMARMCAEVPTLINVHGIGHREALIAKEVTRVFP